MALLDKIEKLSFLSRETTGAAFVIQHEKSTGLFKVVFSNVILSSRSELKAKALDDAIDDAILFIESRRVLVDVPAERFTLFK
jgi:hypothetical protein